MVEIETMSQEELVTYVKSLESTNNELLENLDEVRSSCSFYKEVNEKLTVENMELMKDITILKKVIDKGLDIKQITDDIEEAADDLEDAMEDLAEVTRILKDEKYVEAEKNE